MGCLAKQMQIMHRITHSQQGCWTLGHQTNRWGSMFATPDENRVHRTKGNVPCNTEDCKHCFLWVTVCTPGAELALLRLAQGVLAIHGVVVSACIIDALPST